MTLCAEHCHQGMNSHRYRPRHILRYKTPETNSIYAPEKYTRPQKEAGSHSNHPFSGANLLLCFREGNHIGVQSLSQHSIYRFHETLSFGDYWIPIGNQTVG